MFIKEALLQIKSHIDPHTMIMDDFNTSLSSIDRLPRQKQNREILELNNVINQIDLADIYRTLYPNTKEYTFLPAAHGIFSRIEHTLDTKQASTETRKVK